MRNLLNNIFKKIILFKNYKFYKIKYSLNTKILIKLIKNHYIKFLFLLSYYLFFLSLEKCLDGWDECCTKINWIKLKLIQILLSIFILTILIELIFLGYLSKLNLIHIIIVYILFYNYSHGRDFDNHGFYNLTGSFLIITLLLIGFIPFNIIICLKKINVLFRYI